uniref:ACOX domain-containing protein n=1 Tax=Angiostrongylus cantonensis TaxID=6313 RepID=A0A0K0DP60_ANGCA
MRYHPFRDLTRSPPHNASRAHARMFIATAFFNRIHRVEDASVREVLEDLLLLHLNYELIDQAHYLVQDGYLSSTQLSYMKEELYRLLSKIRPNVVSIVDSFDVPDKELQSVLGRRDGHVYENLYKYARDSALNKHDVLPTFEKYLKPMMKRYESKI